MSDLQDKWIDFEGPSIFVRFMIWGILDHLSLGQKINGDEGMIRIRLDRALAMSEWMAKFQGAKLHHISMSASDHSFLVFCF